MHYSITFTNRAIKSLTKIPNPYYENVKTAIIKLQENPRPSGCKKLKGADAYRIRIADYRVIYQIFDDVLQVDIVDAGHRKDIYK